MSVFRGVAIFSHHSLLITHHFRFFTQKEPFMADRVSLYLTGRAFRFRINQIREYAEQRGFEAVWQAESARPRPIVRWQLSLQPQPDQNRPAASSTTGTRNAAVIAATF